jgi:hypothetical protein
MRTWKPIGEEEGRRTYEAEEVTWGDRRRGEGERGDKVEGEEVEKGRRRVKEKKKERKMGGRGEGKEDRR